MKQKSKLSSKDYQHELEELYRSGFVWAFHAKENALAEEYLKKAIDLALRNEDSLELAELYRDYSTIEAAITVNPGANIQFEASAEITIENSGSFSAVGTSSEPINLSGRFASAGYWRGISFSTNNPNNQLNYVNISDGGQYWGNSYSGVHLNSNGRLEMNNTSITNSNSWGMYVNASCTVICGGATQTDAAGVLSYNTIMSNGAGPDANCSSGGCTVFFD